MRIAVRRIFHLWRRTKHCSWLLFFCLIWFAANWTVNASLDCTSVASATITSSMSGMD